MTCDCNCTGLALDANGKVSTEHYCSCEFGAIRRMSANRKAIMAYRNAGFAKITPEDRRNVAEVLTNLEDHQEETHQIALDLLEAKDKQALYSLLLGIILGACGTVIVLKLCGALP